MGSGSSRSPATSGGPQLSLPSQEVVSLASASARIASAPPAQRATTGQVKIPVVWDKASFLCERVSKQVWNFSAEFNAEVACQLDAFFYCMEQTGDAGSQYIPADKDAPPVLSQSMPQGKGVMRLDGDRAIDLRRWPYEVFWTYKKGIIPIVLSLSAPGIQSVVHLSLVVPRKLVAGEDTNLECKLLCQKVAIDGKDYVLQEVYGLSTVKSDDAYCSQTLGEPCVICLSDPRTTATLPCMHLCACEECAQMLCAQPTNRRCPVCRGDVDGLKVFEVKK